MRSLNTIAAPDYYPNPYIRPIIRTQSLLLLCRAPIMRLLGMRRVTSYLDLQTD